jgi:hypothetical protein
MYRSIVLSGSLLVLFGCGQDSEFLLDFLPVSGQVLMDGAPLAEATVVFVPTDSKQPQPSWGFTDDEGKFSLQSPRRNEGVCAGTYRVVITKMVSADGSPIPAGSGTAAVDGVDLVPGPFNDPLASPHIVTVTKSGEVFNLEVTSSKEEVK